MFTKNAQNSVFSDRHENVWGTHQLRKQGVCEVKVTSLCEIDTETARLRIVGEHA